MAIQFTQNKKSIFKPNLRQVKRWARKRKIEKLCFALDNGMYNVRIASAKALGELRDEKAIPTLRKRLKDKVKTVAEASANALRNIGISEVIESEILEMTEYWKKKEKAARERKKPKNVYIPKWEKRDWVSILKKELMKPMRR